MSNIKVTQEQVDEIIKETEWDAITVFDKCTVVVAKLPNGFVITESSACVDPANYDFIEGQKICQKRIENKIWELEGYALQKKVYELKHQVIKNMGNTTNKIIIIDEENTDEQH